MGKGGGTQKLHDWFVNRRVPGYLRRHLLVVAWGNRVFWIVGLAAFPPATQGQRNTSGGFTLRLYYNGAAVASTGLWSAGAATGAAAGG